MPDDNQSTYVCCFAVQEILHVACGTFSTAVFKEVSVAVVCENFAPLRTALIGCVIVNYVTTNARTIQLRVFKWVKLSKKTKNACSAKERHIVCICVCVFVYLCVSERTHCIIQYYTVPVLNS